MTQPQDLPAIVAGLMDDPRFRDACAHRDMGRLFRMLNHRGLSTRQLAAGVQITQGRLYDYMNGKSRVEKLAIFEQIADALHIPGHFLGLARRPWEPSAVEPRHTAPSPCGSDVEAMDAFRSADRQTGGGRLYAAVVNHLSERVARRLLDVHVDRAVFAAAAAMTEMAGWMAHDSGRDALAERHFAKAMLLAQTSGDALLTANIAASNSHLALQSGRPEAAMQWARSGFGHLERCPRLPSLAARLHAMTARALAVTEQRQPALRELEMARACLQAAADATHVWASPFDAAALASESALALADLGLYAGALRHAEEAVRLREEGRTRSKALGRITVVDLHARRNDLDAVVCCGYELLATSPTLSSVRFVNQLAGLRDTLDNHRAYPPVRTFLTRFDEAVRARRLLLADLISPRSGGHAHEADTR
ncbi:helix-turn-helix domain-containing protein [Streptomyces monomycini]|uniref:helix-turn-helix domain-containing protein n=1 Tax=Streptomyces monomycini TaxID=371720 RepID=UPI0004A9F9D5|nr:helix-turn-helix transcriptional regulator [Streptomyces monomycini]